MLPVSCIPYFIGWYCQQMPRTRGIAPLIVMSLAGLTLLGCSSSGGATPGEESAPAEAVVTGEAVELGAEQAALCEQIVAQGLPADAAAALAEASGYTYVVVQSGQESGAAAGTLVFTSADDIVVDCGVA